MIEQMIKNYKEVKNYFEGIGVYGLENKLPMKFNDLKELAKQNNTEIKFQNVDRPDIDYSHQAYFYIGDTRFISIIQYEEAIELGLRKKLN